LNTDNESLPMTDVGSEFQTAVYTVWSAPIVGGFWSRDLQAGGVCTSQI